MHPKSSLFVLTACLLAGCGTPRTDVTPSIQFTKVPAAVEGGPNRLEPIEGRVAGARAGQRIVLYARSGGWWVQPHGERALHVDSVRRAPGATPRTSGPSTPPCSSTADYRPPARADALPSPGGSVIAVATAKGEGAVEGPARKLTFSGYEWQIRQVPSDRGGANDYDPANAWTDDERRAAPPHCGDARDRWTSAEVILTRSLGYGTYSFVVRDVSHLEPAAAFGMFTWDDLGVEQNHREVGVEISRWGDPANQNAQYVIQPYYVAANVARFTAPAGRLTHSFRWEPGRVSFKTRHRRARQGRRADRRAARSDVRSAHARGPSRSASISMSSATRPFALKNGAEVVIEKFEYLP